MIINLENKTAWVGGASSGLGLAAARQLAASGATVILVSRNEQKLKEILAELPAPQEQQHRYLQVDFTDFESFQSIVSKFFETNQVDIMVNNTSGPPAGAVLAQTDTAYLEAFSLLFRTVQFSSSLALKHMQDRQWGRIINLTSRTVKEPAANLALSNTIRAAVTTWGKTLASAVASTGITVNNILTGNFDTERLRELFEKTAADLQVPVEQVYAQSTDAIPMKRLGRPEELAQVITFLASEQASYLTGTSIAVDGGLIRSL
ncbi:SDR family oxidoreductase [Niabella terrae]